MVNLSQVKLFSLIGFLLLSLSAQAVTSIVMSVDTNPAVINESLELQVTVDDHVRQNQLDLSVLDNDFRVLGTSVSTETRIVNGSSSKITRFSTRLIAKRVGKIRIPPVTIDGISSNPIQLEVVGSRSSQVQSQADSMVFVKTSLSANEVWLHQQLTYTTKLYINNATPLERGSLSQPELANALIEQIGKDKESSELLNGVRYRVITREYTITPQQSGEYQLDSPFFQGEIVVGRRGFYNNTKTINRVGETQPIKVKAIPANYSGHWLPSELVLLHDEITPVDGYKVGEPITRTITLSALNVSHELLPELNVNYPSSVKAYPDQAETHSNYRNNKIFAQRKESTALVPNKAGKIVLPEVRVNWWNTDKQKMETSIIAERSITVAAAKATQTTAAPTTLAPAAPLPNTQTTTEYVEISAPWQFNQLVLVILTAWLLTLVGWFGHIKMLTKKSKPKQQADNKSDSEKRAWQQLTKAIKKADRSQIQTLLPVWLSAFSQQNINSMHQALNHLADNQIAAEINQMQAASFASKTSSWQSDKLAQLLKQYREQQIIRQSQQANTSSKGHRLAPLNP